VSGDAVRGGRRTTSGTPEDDDAQLIERIRARDMRAFESLYRKYHPRLTRFLTNLIRRPQMRARVAVAIETPAHAERLLLRHDLHLIDAAVTLDAPDAAVHVRGVI